MFDVYYKPHPCLFQMYNYCKENVNNEEIWRRYRQRQKLGFKNIHNTKFYSEKIEALARFALPNTKYSIHNINQSLLDWTDSHITTIL